MQDAIIAVATNGSLLFDSVIIEDNNAFGYPSIVHIEDSIAKVSLIINWKEENLIWMKDT